MLSSKHIIADVARETGVTPEDLCGDNRTHAVAKARFIAIYAIRHILGLSYHQILRTFGYKNHTSIMYALARVEKTPALKTIAARIVARHANRQTA